MATDRLNRFVGFVALVGLLVASACARSSTRNVGDREEYSEVTRHSFALTDPAFLSRFSGDSSYILSPPATTSLVPPSIELYRAHPNDWWETEEYRARYPMLENPKVNKILAIVDSGTSVRVTRVEHRVFSYGDIYRFYAVIESGPEKGTKVILDSVYIERGENDVAVPNPKYLKVVGDS